MKTYTTTDALSDLHAAGTVRHRNASLSGHCSHLVADFRIWANRHLAYCLVIQVRDRPAARVSRTTPVRVQIAPQAPFG